MELNRNKNLNLSFGRVFILLLAGTLFLFQSCKMSYSFSGASTTGLTTFSAPYFQNRAPLVQPGLSQYITDELIDKCKAQTSMKYITGLGDASFEGEITDYNTRPLSVAADAQAAMNRFTITVKVKFTNSVEPDNSYEQTFSRYQDYNATLDLSQVEKDLTQKVVEMIVEDIFNAAFVNW